MHPRSCCIIGAVLCALLAARAVRAAAPVAVVIGEVAWAGSDRSANDEWIELAAAGDGEPRSLSGWTVTGLRSSGQEEVMVRFGAEHVVAAGDTRVVLRMVAAESRVAAVPLLVASTLSLPNTKLRLRLRNEHGEVVDVVDDGSGAPFAGANPSGGVGRASMERIDLSRSGEDPENWRTASASRGFADGPAIYGTPGSPPDPEPVAPEPERPPTTIAGSGACTAGTAAIVVQSGQVRGPAPLSINLMASDAVPLASCRWSFGDGGVADTCNPRSHRFDAPGSYQVVLAGVDACGRPSESTLMIEAFDEGRTSRYPSCVPDAFTGIVISEALPRPGPGGEEWIELHNRSGKERRLCGWLLDDDEGGSAPFALDGWSIADEGWLVLDRSVTGLTLNDADDAIRLIRPDGEPIDMLRYDHAPAGESRALRDDGHALWTPEPTPGAANRFREPESVDAPPTFCIAAVQPVPRSGEQAWLDLRNCSGRPQFLRSILLAPLLSDGSVGAKRTTFGRDDALHAWETLRLDEEALGWPLADDDAGVALLDTHGTLLSALVWANPSPGDVIAAPADAQIIATVESVNDDGALEVRALSVGPGSPHLPLRFVLYAEGIDLPVEQEWRQRAAERLRSLLADRQVRLRFGSRLHDLNGMLRAHIALEDGDACLACALLQEGLARLRTDAVDAPALAPYEAEARRELRGMWTLPSAAEHADLHARQRAFAQMCGGDGLRIISDTKAGAVASGAVVTLRPNIDGALFVSVNSGAYKLSSGVLRIHANAAISAYVAVTIPGTDVVLQSPVWQGEFLPVRFSTEPVLISEIQPRSVDGVPEWVELFNPGDADVDLAGWRIDDVATGGSRAWVIPSGFALKPQERIIFTKDQTHVTLNDDGDAVHLLRPDGSVADAVQLPPVKAQRSWARVGGRWCVAEPTPNAENVCTKPLAKAKATPKGGTRRSSVRRHTLAVARFPADRQHFFGFPKDSVEVGGSAVMTGCLMVSCTAQCGAWWLLRRRV